MYGGARFPLLGNPKALESWTAWLLNTSLAIPFAAYPGGITLYPAGKHIFYFNYPKLKTMMVALLSEAQYVHMHIYTEPFANTQKPSKTQAA